MDSLTQIVLGAACGEAVLGKKIGNKALLFGAIGGTIPDLDVFIGSWIYTNEIDSMMFHRGFMHSFLFTILGAFVFAWLFFKLYDTGKRKQTTTYKNWFWLFFWSMVTHPILDTFTSYGTQLFAPFNDWRVAFKNISVVDLFYTLPFLICLIVLMFFNRKSKTRRLWLKLGIGISSLYMLFTIGNKLYVDSIYEKSFDEAGIEYSRFSVQPTIFNNILWYGIAETETDFYVGFYSLLDKSNRVENILKITKTDESLDLNYTDIQKLIWFSNGYFKIRKEGNALKYMDLRYSLSDESDPNSSVFSFELYKKGKRWDIQPFKNDTPEESDLIQFWERIKGK